LTWAATPTPETGVVGSAPPEPVGLRQHIIAQLDFWAGATEGEKAPEGEAKFEEFRTSAALDTQRKAFARQGRTYTTCVEFLGHALESAATGAHVKPKVPLTQLNANLVFEENRKKLPQGAWHDGKPKMSERPKPGDFYVMMFAEDVYEQKQDPKTQEWKKEKTHGKDEFSHIGYVRSISKNPKKEGETTETETWETVDGGAGLAGRYKYEQVADKDDPKKKVDKFTLLKQGAEKIELFSRVYIPETNIFPGGVANQSPGKRYLLGWIDVDYIV